MCVKVDRDAVPHVSLSIDTYLLPLPDINNDILPRSIYTYFISRSISRSVDRAKQLWTVWTQFWWHRRFSKSMCIHKIYNISFTVRPPYVVSANKRFKSKSKFSDNFYRLFQYLVVFTDEFGHWLDICFYWDCYWDIFVIERNDWFHVYSGLPKYSNGNTPILNRIKSFEYFQEAFVLGVIYAFFPVPTYSCSYTLWYFEILNSLKMIITARENQ